MRLALVTQWLRAAHDDPGRRATSLRYAFGVAVLQVLWVARLAVPDEYNIPTIAGLIVAELLVPVWAENAAHTAWHPHHIAERYGLFTLIVLGETVLVATIAVQQALDAGHKDLSLLALAGAGLIIVFSMWWLYFSQPSPRLNTAIRAFSWGYGHFFIFAAAAAVGAGLAVAVDYDTGVSHIDARTAALALSIPAAAYVLAVWALIVLPSDEETLALLFPACAVAIIIVGLIPAPIHLIAALLALLVLATLHLAADDS
jgi:low temperature requirement protein LtrA